MNIKMEFTTSISMRQFSMSLAAAVINYGIIRIGVKNTNLIKQTGMNTLPLTDYIRTLKNG